VNRHIAPAAPVRIDSTVAWVLKASASKKNATTIAATSPAIRAAHSCRSSSRPARR
jgi:hypothetical protein